MSASCCHDCHDDDPQRGNPAYRRVLWSVLAINAVMFALEIGAGLAAGSASLQADALDFLGDAGNYAISLLVVGMALRYRAMAALMKGSTMAIFGLWVLAITGWHAWHASRIHYGRGWLYGVGRECRFVCIAVDPSLGRRQYAFGVDLHAE
jgi:Co/Zn/Cd efflux system component